MNNITYEKVIILIDTFEKENIDPILFLKKEHLELTGGEHKNSLLHYAAYTGYVNTINVLINLGMNVDITDQSGLTPLHYASKKENIEACKLLLSKGAKVDHADEDGNTCLHRSCESSSMVKFLVDNGANINTKNKYGSTVLHHACGRSFVDTIKVLLSNGADTTIKNDDLFLAKELTVNKEILNLFKEHKKKNIKNAQKENVKKLLVALSENNEFIDKLINSIEIK